ncbi:MAG: hypothetical protein BBJ60_08570 [Desulfobacterales bacterium S7086C20]|nr:MAG: hypothetical protein BBJ60_08570 [Desulfobacterales bacterium S7086C20]
MPAVLLNRIRQIQPKPEREFCKVILERALTAELLDNVKYLDYLALKCVLFGFEGKQERRML